MNLNDKRNLLLNNYKKWGNKKVKKLKYYRIWWINWYLWCLKYEFRNSNKLGWSWRFLFWIFEFKLFEEYIKKGI